MDAYNTAIGSKTAFNTGRDYSPEGQIIELTVIGHGEFIDEKYLIIRLNDKTRGIDYIIDLPAGYYNSYSVLSVYDGARKKMHYSHMIKASDFPYLEDVVIGNLESPW